MADDCISVGITPVILSPFVFGSRYATKNAILYTDALNEWASKRSEPIVIDCIRLFSPYSRMRILLKDGFHISDLAHRLIGQAVGQAIVRRGRERALKQQQQTARLGCGRVLAAVGAST
jgi:hypothetical protein